MAFSNTSTNNCIQIRISFIPLKPGSYLSTTKLKNVKVTRFANGVQLSTVRFSEQTSWSRWGHGYVSAEGCVLSGRGLSDGPISRPEESYRV